MLRINYKALEIVKGKYLFQEENYTGIAYKFTKGGSLEDAFVMA